ncbi:uncharacterized protein LOC108104021 [Drosophila eugracilis]|uniref:uncharacterized protein LOC108104021 n=1 Tax=Drosophila eugracilis TaxID=29029 RepID=UPI001BDA613D|nr:uncharacterized protein LOC108104021 [Drosophila eugracilis]
MVSYLQLLCMTPVSPSPGNHLKVHQKRSLAPLSPSARQWADIGRKRKAEKWEKNNKKSRKTEKQFACAANVKSMGHKQGSTETEKPNSRSSQKRKKGTKSKPQHNTMKLPYFISPKCVQNQNQFVEGQKKSFSYKYHEFSIYDLNEAALRAKMATAKYFEKINQIQKLKIEYVKE